MSAEVDPVRYWRELCRSTEMEHRRLRCQVAEAIERTETERRRPDLDSALLDNLLRTLRGLVADR